jgi:hypothetical protein
MKPLCLTTLVLVGLLSGCGSSDKPKLGQVTGKVTRNGLPVIGAKVYFSPVEGGRTSEGVTQGDGSYELVYLRDEKGAIIGEHKVRITTYEPPIDLDGGGKEGGRPEEIPPKYSSGEERRTVNAGSQVIDFEVTQ